MGPKLKRRIFDIGARKLKETGSLLVNLYAIAIVMLNTEVLRQSHFIVIGINSGVLI
jgi:hypothetical protein